MPKLLKYGLPASLRSRAVAALTTGALALSSSLAPLFADRPERLIRVFVPDLRKMVGVLDRPDLPERVAVG